MEPSSTAVGMEAWKTGGGTGVASVFSSLLSQPCPCVGVPIGPPREIHPSCMPTWGVGGWVRAVARVACAVALAAAGPGTAPRASPPQASAAAAVTDAASTLFRARDEPGGEPSGSLCSGWHARWRGPGLVTACRASLRGMNDPFGVGITSLTCGNPGCCLHVPSLPARYAVSWPDWRYSQKWHCQAESLSSAPAHPRRTTLNSAAPVTCRVSRETTEIPGEVREGRSGKHDAGVIRRSVLGEAQAFERGRDLGEGDWDPYFSGCGWCCGTRDNQGAMTAQGTVIQRRQQHPLRWVVVWTCSIVSGLAASAILCGWPYWRVHPWAAMITVGCRAGFGAAGSLMLTDGRTRACGIASSEPALRGPRPGRRTGIPGPCQY